MAAMCGLNTADLARHQQGAASGANAGPRLAERPPRAARLTEAPKAGTETVAAIGTAAPVMSDTRGSLTVSRGTAVGEETTDAASSRQATGGETHVSTTAAAWAAAGGSRAERYELLGEIGQGGMGAVLEGARPRTRT